jgi:drug/metabolite transporter (DMT)-like permease
LFALAVGFFIASYSITDATGARLVGSAFSFFGAMAIFNRLFLIAYLYCSDKGIAQRIQQQFDYRFVLAGLFAFICYAVVLWAYTVLPITIVATLRESSVVFATLFGIFVLRENLNMPKLFMLGAVTSGLFLLLNG